MKLLNMGWLRVAVVLLGLYLLIKGIIPGWTSMQTDFPNYYVSAQLLLDGEDVQDFYRYDWFNQQIHRIGISKDGNFGPFPPITSLVMVPLARFEPMAAKRVWLLINLVILGFVVSMTSRQVEWSRLESLGYVLAAGIALAANFRFGQVYLLLLLAMLLAYDLEKRGKEQWAGLILGTLVVLKYYPVFLVLVYLWRRKFEVVRWTGVAVVALLLLQWTLFGSATEYYYFQVLPGHLTGHLPAQGAFPIQFQSWNSLFNNLFVLDPENNPEPWLDWPTGKLIGLAVVYLVVAGVTALALIRARQSLEIDMGLFGLAVMSLLPATGSYHFLMMLFPLAFILAHVPHYRIHLIVLYLLLGFFPVSLISGMDLPLPLLYPRLWMVNLIWLVSCWSVWRGTGNYNPQILNY